MNADEPDLQHRRKVPILNSERPSYWRYPGRGPNGIGAWKH